MSDLFAAWGTPVERERRRRIKLSIWAYAYELAAAPLVDDATFDREAYLSDVTINTGRLDDWWRASFTPYTGQWIRSHPELDQVKITFDNHCNDHYEIIVGSTGKE